MHLNKPRFGLKGSATLQERTDIEMQHSRVQRIRLGQLMEPAHMTETSPTSLGASAHAEARRAQTQAQSARENALTRIQLARQLPR